MYLKEMIVVLLRGTADRMLFSCSCDRRGFICIYRPVHGKPYAGTNSYSTINRLKPPINVAQTRLQITGRMQSNSANTKHSCIISQYSDKCSQINHEE